MRGRFDREMLVVFFVWGDYLPEVVTDESYDNLTSHGSCYLCRSNFDGFGEDLDRGIAAS